MSSKIISAWLMMVYYCPGPGAENGKALNQNHRRRTNLTVCDGLPSRDRRAK